MEMCLVEDAGEIMTTAYMPALHDREGRFLPDGLPVVIDAHVHIFPSGIFGAVHRWFADHAWPIRYQLRSTEVVEFLLDRGVAHIVALQYAHKPGMARDLNAYMARKVEAFSGRMTGMATVFPGEDGAEEILADAFATGLGGLKLHAHVQCFAVDSPPMRRLYGVCQAAKKPVLVHAGREPNFPAYRCDPHQLCGADRVERVLRDFADLKVCVPHLGFDETEAYRRLIDRYDNLWLDTTMAMAGYFPSAEGIDLGRYRPDRVMYGSDFPNIPYAWDRELLRLRAQKLSAGSLAAILHGNAVEFYGLQPLAGQASPSPFTVTHRPTGDTHE